MSSISGAATSAAEATAYYSLGDYESAAVSAADAVIQTAEVTHSTPSDLVEATRECAKNPDWDPDPGC